MKVAILGSRSGWHEARLAHALRERGAETVVAPITALAAAVSATGATAATGRGAPLPQPPPVIDPASPPGASASTTARR